MVERKNSLIIAALSDMAINRTEFTQGPADLGTRVFLSVCFFTALIGNIGIRL